MSTSATFLGPVNELPPEGTDRKLETGSEVDVCASMFADSGLTFDVSRDGAFVQSNPQEADLFQEFSVRIESPEEEPYLEWRDNAFNLHLQGLFRDRNAFATLSDASEPEDYVRRFLEVLTSSLDDPSLPHQGNTLPLIRWQPGDDGESAQVQLLGLLLANDEQFERFCKTNNEVGLIFEDAEVEAHGVRETFAALALIGISLGSVTEAEAGLFANMKAKKEAKQMRIAQINAIEQAQHAAIQRAQQTGWLDVHNDAYINYQLLESGSDNRKVIVDVGRQRAFLLIDNQVAIDTAVSTARSDKHTPRGTFKITERVATGKTSTIYGCDLPYWQRLDSSAIGMHVGDLPGYPASAGCIRLPHSVAPVMFEGMSSGMTVEVVDLWDAQELQSNSQPMLVAQVNHNQ
ncbi:MAG: L,D-transpeptidase [Verrucomicrobiota bacterium]